MLYLLLNMSRGGGNMNIEQLINMKPQAINSDKDLVKEFQKVRKKLLKKKFNKLTFENSSDHSSRLWFEDRRIMSYDAKKDEALVRFGNGDELWIGSGLLNINRLIVVKSIAEYLLSVA